MSLKISYFGDPILRKKGRKVVDFDESLLKFSEEMLALMHESEGIG